MDREKQLKAFYKGTLPQEEVEEFLQWYHSKEGEAFLERSLEEHWQEAVSAKSKADTFDQEATFRKILEQQGKRPAAMKPEVNKRIDQRGMGFKIAAGLAIFLSLSLLGYEYFWGKNAGSLPTEVVAMHVKSNPAGQKSKLKLPDEIGRAHV